MEWGPEPEDNNGLFARVTAEKQVFAFLGQPVVETVIWVGGEKLPYDPGSEYPSDCMPKKVYKSNVVKVVGKVCAESAQILDMGPSLYKAVRECIGKHGIDIGIEVYKTGEGMKTRYSGLFDCKLNADQKGVLAGIDVHPLEREETDGPPF